MKFHGKLSKFTNWNPCRRTRHGERHCTLGRRCSRICALRKGADHGSVPGLSPEHADVQNQMLIAGDIPPACSPAEQLRRLECEVNLRYEVLPTHNAPFFSKYAPTARFKFNTSLLPSLRSFLSQTQKGAAISQWVSQFKEDTWGQIRTCQPHGEHTKLGSARNESHKRFRDGLWAKPVPGSP